VCASRWSSRARTGLFDSGVGVNARPLIVVANRLPVQPAGGPGDVWERAPGGLVSALSGVVRATDATWVGWPGPGRGEPPAEIDGLKLRSVHLGTRDLRDYYEGFSNSSLWPLYHWLVKTPVYRRDWWAAYVRINERFAEAVDAAAPVGALVWVHDYHLQLLPELLRARRPDLRTGFFLHVPFPAPEIFGQLPWRRAVLDGACGADLIGFQTDQDASNFGRAVSRWASAGDRAKSRQGPRVGSFPISVDFQHWSSLAARPDVRRRAAQLRRELGQPHTVLLGIDRLDYIKGIDLRLEAFRELLREGRVTVPSTVFVQVATPSRDRTPSYRYERERIERLVGAINGDFGQIGSPAVNYLHRSLDQSELPALYACADVMLVTSIHDGMNLVAKEFVASRTSCDGVLVLSEFTGAAAELDDALIVNPHDVDALKQAVVDAIEIPEGEERARMSAMRRRVAEHDVHKWMNTFLAALAGDEDSSEGLTRLAARTEVEDALAGAP
jgi:trehalose 6-phosphate synthase